MNTQKNILLGAALAGLMLASPHADAKKSKATHKKVEVAMGECHGVNSCKGHGECGGADHACAGKNSCKGKGWIKASKADCEKQGGEFKAM